jgi:hypothetical protein
VKFWTILINFVSKKRFTTKAPGKIGEASLPVRVMQDLNTEQKWHTFIWDRHLVSKLLKCFPHFGKTYNLTDQSTKNRTKIMGSICTSIWRDWPIIHVPELRITWTPTNIFQCICTYSANQSTTTSLEQSNIFKLQSNKISQSCNKPKLVKITLQLPLQQ